jgi:nucleoside-diphosphate-sugar epimerase
MEISKNKKHYIIFGGAGYVGIFLIHALVKKEPDSKITIITKNQTKSVFFRFDQVYLSNDISSVVNEDIIIINLAYSMGDSYSDTKLQNKKIIDDISQLTNKNKVERIIHVSSIVLSLDQKPWSKVKVVKNNTYYYAKSFAESAFMKLSSETKVPVAILRSGNIVGPGSPWVNTILKNLTEGLPITGHKDNYPSNSTYVGNLSETIINLANYKELKTSVMNCCEFGNIPWNQIINDLNMNFEFPVVKWDIESVDEVKPTLKSDLKHIKSSLISFTIPMLYKGRYFNNVILKMLDFFGVKGAKTNMKSKLNKKTGKTSKYTDLTEYDQVKVFMNEKGYKLENMPESIAKSIPYDYAFFLKSVKEWIAISGFNSFYKNRI